MKSGPGRGNGFRNCARQWSWVRGAAMELGLGRGNGVETGRGNGVINRAWRHLSQVRGAATESGLGRGNGV